MTERSTWLRAVHLAVGAGFAVVCALVSPGLQDMSPETLSGLHIAPLPPLLLLACVPAVRRSEGVQARALLLSDDDDVAVDSSQTWGDRGRLFAWLVVRVELGVLAAELTALGVGAAWSLLGGTSPSSAPRWAALPLAAGLFLVWVYSIAAVGALAAVIARLLLHPSTAERLRAQEERTAQLLERTRLAAELHDSIGHALTITLLQAAAARDVADRDRAFVDRALVAIEDSARQAAEDLERVLALIRDSSPSAAAPTLVDVGGLVRSVEAAGATVDLRLPDDLGDLPTEVSREAYRIVQEALTNVLRHAGPVPIQLGIDTDGEELRIAVRNPVPATAAQGEGRGIPGLHERVAVLGGTAHVGSSGSEWRVEVLLPSRYPA
ncbi:MAG TPA: histidine kinase [Intrasporangium sp.]|uniref:sensor histidine kinase n=1 Tax=Intrasporangium sp. TaxID=1925024 RepID=UPI002F9218EC